jgi:hypothetical protein
MKMSVAKKTLLSVAFAAAIAFVFAACDLFDKADEITIPSEIEVVWTVDENADQTNFAYTQTKTVKLSDAPEFEKYLDKVKEVKVERITYKITDYNDDPHHEQVYFKDGVASFASAGTSTPAVTVPFAATASGVNLQTVTSEVDLAIDADGLNKLAAIFKQEKELDMNAVGTLTRTPVSFKIVSTFHVKIVAEVLN